MSQATSWIDVVNSVIGAVRDILYHVARTIASNAATLAEVLVGVGIAAFVFTQATRLFPGLRNILGRLF